MSSHVVQKFSTKTVLKVLIGDDEETTRTNEHFFFKYFIGTQLSSYHNEHGNKKNGANESWRQWEEASKDPVGIQ